jgi:hypothetical protein
MTKSSTWGIAALTGILITSGATAQERKPETPNDLASARALFAGADVSKDGSVSADEAARAGISRRVLLALDHDGDGSLSSAEFTVGYRQALLDAHRPVSADLEAEAGRLLALRKQRELDSERERVLQRGSGPASRRIAEHREGIDPAGADVRRRIANAEAEGRGAPQAGHSGGPGAAPARPGSEARQRLAAQEAEGQPGADARRRLAGATPPAPVRPAPIPGETRQRMANAEAETTPTTPSDARLRTAGSGEGSGGPASERLPRERQPAPSQRPVRPEASPPSSTPAPAPAPVVRPAPSPPSQAPPVRPESQEPRVRRLPPTPVPDPVRPPAPPAQRERGEKPPPSAPDRGTRGPR